MQKPHNFNKFLAKVMSCCINCLNLNDYSAPAHLFDATCCCVDRQCAYLRPLKPTVRNPSTFSDLFSLCLSSSWVVEFPYGAFQASSLFVSHCRISGCSWKYKQYSFFFPAGDGNRFREHTEMRSITLPSVLGMDFTKTKEKKENQTVRLQKYTYT